MTDMYSLDHIVKVADGNIDSVCRGASLLLPQLLQKALSPPYDQVISPISEGGVLIKSLDELVSLLKANEGRLLLEKNDQHGFVYVWQDGSYLDIFYEPEGSKYLSLYGHMLNRSLQKMLDEIEQNYLSEDSRNLVFVIVQRGDRLELQLIGNGSSPMIRENYTPQVMKDVDFVVSAFKKSPPHGRICLLNGEPGTGKTHLIRAMLSEMDNTFIVIPSGLIDLLDKPTLIPVLLDAAHGYEKSLTLIIEDGDMCLVPREADNMSSISSLLNLSDGIVGTMVDIKMIVSTNVKIKNLDPAILRPGRLCRQIEVDALGYNQAVNVYRRLTGNPHAVLPAAKSFTLAQVYEFANNQEAEINHRPQIRAVGFGM